MPLAQRSSYDLSNGACRSLLCFFGSVLLVLLLLLHVTVNAESRYDLPTVSLLAKRTIYTQLRLFTPHHLSRLQANCGSTKLQKIIKKFTSHVANNARNLRLIARPIVSYALERNLRGMKTYSHYAWNNENGHIYYPSDDLWIVRAASLITASPVFCFSPFIVMRDYQDMMFAKESCLCSHQ
jgi:hypothetical protein